MAPDLGKERPIKNLQLPAMPSKHYFLFYTKVDSKIELQKLKMALYYPPDRFRLVSPGVNYRLS